MIHLKSSSIEEDKNINYITMELFGENLSNLRRSRLSRSIRMKAFLVSPEESFLNSEIMRRKKDTWQDHCEDDH